MKTMKPCAVLLLLIMPSIFVFAQKLNSQQFREDFDYLWENIRTDYAYWKKKNINWNKVKEIYSAQADTVSSKWYFTLLLERMLNELYDHHISLNTNTSASQRLVPTGADVWAEWKDGKAMIIDVRRDYGAWKAGIRPGMEVIAFNNIPVVQAASSYLPKSLERYDSTAHNYALNVLLAGIHSAERKITVLENKIAKERYPDSSGTITTYQSKELLEWKVLQGNVGYIRFNNSLGNNDLIPLFDTALNRLFSTSAMILDLRETPSGGNTTVARAIMSQFITKEGFYQKHVLEAEERQYGVRRSWQEIVSPRGKRYTKSMVVLVSHWTGSVGEGLAIGFDALKRATVVGTQMAGLNGGMYHYLMPNSRISLSLPVEQLYHINGTPREDFLPPKTVVMQGKEEDEILLAALRVLSKKK